MSKIVWFVIKIIVLGLIACFLCARGFHWYKEQLIPYIDNALDSDMGSDIWSDALGFVETALPILGTIVGWVFALFKFVIGVTPKLNEDNLFIYLCDVDKERNIPKMLCVPSRKTQEKELDIGMFDVHKAELELVLAGENIDEISQFIMRKVSLQTAQSENRYIYREFVMCNNLQEKDTVLLKKIPPIYVKDYVSGKVIINTFLYMFRSNYALRKGFPDIGKLFRPLDCEMTVEVSLAWINRCGRPIFRTYTKRLIQEYDQDSNIYWKTIKHKAIPNEK